MTTKTMPVEFDSAATRLFSPAPGVRAWVHGVWARGVPSTLDDSTVFLPEGSSYGLVRGAVEALDTDDPATVGVMLSQVEAACGKPVDLLWRRTRAGDVEYVVEWFDPPSRLIKTPPGPTRGAALVAAMRQLKVKR